jgi:hypothetical protein
MSNQCACGDIECIDRREDLAVTDASEPFFFYLPTQEELIEMDLNTESNLMEIEQ